MLDASVAVRAALAETWTTRWDNDDLTAPTLMWSEAASALRQLAMRGEISDTEATNAVRWLSESTIDAHASATLVVEAIELAGQLGWAKTYDAEYVALARRLGASLITADARLRRGVERVVSVRGPQEG